MTQELRRPRPPGRTTATSSRRASADRCQNPLPPARLHDLRHVDATTLLVAGMPVYVVAERLSHSDPAITLRVYAHVIRQHAEGVAAKFAQAVDGELDLDQDGDEDDGPDTAPRVPC